MRTFIQYILHGHGQSSPSLSVTTPQALDLPKEWTRILNSLFGPSSISLVSPNSEVESCLRCSLWLSVSFEHSLGRSVVVEEEGWRAIWSWGWSGHGGLVFVGIG